MSSVSGHRPRAVPARLPHPALVNADWADCFEIEVKGRSMTASQAAVEALGATPRWIDFLMRLRNRIVSLVGLKSAGGSVKSGDGMIGAFPVVSTTDSEVVLGFDDKHLNFRIIVSVENCENSLQRIRATTLVHRNNLAGRLYLLFVTPFHKKIVPVTLSRLNQLQDTSVRPVSLQR